MIKVMLQRDGIYCPFIPPSVIVANVPGITPRPDVSVHPVPCMVGNCAIWNEVFGECSMKRSAFTVAPETSK